MKPYLIHGAFETTHGSIIFNGNLIVQDDGSLTGELSDRFGSSTIKGSITKESLIFTKTYNPGYNQGQTSEFSFKSVTKEKFFSFWWEGTWKKNDQFQEAKKTTCSFETNLATY